MAPNLIHLYPTLQHDLDLLYLPQLHELHTLQCDSIMPSAAVLVTQLLHLFPTA